MKIFLSISLLTILTLQTNGQSNTDFLNRALNFIEVDISDDRFDRLAIGGLGRQLDNFEEHDFFGLTSADSTFIRLIWERGWEKDILINIYGSKNNFVLVIKTEENNTRTIEHFNIAELTNKETRLLKRYLTYGDFNPEIEAIISKSVIADSVKYHYSRATTNLSENIVAELIEQLNKSNFYGHDQIDFSSVAADGWNWSLEVVQPGKEFYIVMSDSYSDHPNDNDFSKVCLRIINLATELDLIEKTDW
ncbi:hypothetical protein QYS48_05190 [Marivirga arenosa]|uniref:Uncharacterized protein n=1 Tax=Marivirga arenosa TaxID=3059076 RepID=A0AA49GG80_9BACT|nr:hypothetical protein [Marivirga sp. ABR2-2]WKK86361.2 hypothetical protein QYS48_05190 [Marivirga sp. ABR2-2]